MNSYFDFVTYLFLSFSGLVFMLYPYYSRRKRQEIRDKVYSEGRSERTPEEDRILGEWFGIFGSNLMIFLGFIFLSLGTYHNIQTNSFYSTLILWSVIAFLFVFLSNLFKGKVDNIAGVSFIVAIVLLLIG